MVVMESKGLEYGHVRRNELDDDSKDEFEITSDIMKEKYKNLTMYETLFIWMSNDGD